mgnify:CR=1 FL=1
MQNEFKHQANTSKQGCKTKQVSYRACSKRSNGATHTLQTRHSNKLSKTATRHLASIKTICYSNSTWKQKAWTWCTGKAQQNMNTELSPEITRTCSKGHGKIANNNSFTDLAEITGHGRNNIRLQSLELSNNMLQEYIIANKGMAWIY